VIEQVYSTKPSVRDHHKIFRQWYLFVKIRGVGRELLYQHPIIGLPGLTSFAEDYIRYPDLQEWTTGSKEYNPRFED
jgi:hypothetical protein